MKSICLMVLCLVELVLANVDLDALLELKKGIEKDPSGKVLVSWDSKSLAPDGCPRDWYGIICNEGHVVSITLVDISLVGVFDFSAISGLEMLRNLSVSNNRLSGTITKEVGLIESLEYLDLSHNLFSGPIPSQLTELKNMVLLNLSSNNLEGVVPSDFAMLEELKYLDVRSNGLTGNIMDLLAQLGSVVFVDLSNNNFSGSLDIGLGNADFVSSINYLNISRNNLGDDLFPHDGMPFFDNLEVFDASDNHFTGNLPSFNFVVSLRVLRLGRNMLSGSLPDALLLESSTLLSELDISHNHLEGPVGTISSTTLRNLNLSFNQLSGPLPAKVGHCATVDLSNNMLTGNLSRIQAWGNYIEVIMLNSNLLVGSLPERTSQFLRLTSLRISNNSLEGVLPPVLSTYPELKTIDFSLNQLSGSLLADLFNSSKLININMSFNNFEGIIPVEAINGQDLSLVSLDLSHNGLTGILPTDLDKFQHMIYLDLSHNHLEGSIPVDLPVQLQVFNVSYNNLSGIVPENLQRFPDSAFHPGNPLLTVPGESNPQQGELNVNPGRHGSHMSSGIRAALIAGLVGGSVIIAVVLLLICYRSHELKDKRSNCKVTEKTVDQTSLSKVESGHDPAGTSSDRKLENLGICEPVKTTDDMTSPTSMTSTALTSTTNVQSLSEIPSSLTVYSPDKLAGDLHLFDKSLRFTAEDLSCAPAEIVGTSCHGTLYKAVVGGTHVLAVKWLKEGLAKGRGEFAREVRKLGNIRHPNLVSLQGYYWGPKDHEKLIMSNYINAPCLALCLHDEDVKKLRPLSLNERFKIAIDVARCLNYLHNERSIPHGNLKSTNILVESPNSNALLTDYSLHRIMTSAGTTEQVLTAGVLGYRPPEFATTSKPCPSMKSDVYAFGVILLELLTGHDPAEIVPVNSDILDLTEWVTLLVAQNRSIECFDQHILATQNAERLQNCLDNMLQIALRCILPAAERPDMKMVFDELSATVLEYTTER
ncbi:hypothetical protein LIER_32734 [Lithospermum erythrorhizon]|uniref:Protein kinase domain-containing protein n=1 Tax=Lithospermum erythrorhizon TaxID=34254 RepID=A0AAV3S014_LITER